MRFLCVLLLLLLLMAHVRPATGDIICDGADDDLESGLSLSTFMSASTGSLLFWYKPTGTPSWSTTTNCYDGERTIGNWDVTAGNYMGIYRHGNLGGNDRLCAWNWDGDEDLVEAAYVPGAWTHLAWVHSGGTLDFYKDGVLQGSVPSGNTENITETFRVCTGGTIATGRLPGEGVVTGVEVFPTAVPATETTAKANARLHRFGRSNRSGAWTLDGCTTPADADGVSFYDHSGNGRTLTGNNGPDNNGLTCLGNTLLTYPWGPE